ncbi:MAG: hypothetical protein M1820_003590 [Bogoriella megaspora]|nr:MAG: hypothetical protein M1820_003590 [Bogoriella megaspora]
MPQSDIKVDDLPPLSNRDVRILFAIVNEAQASPDTPFRALFAAYDRVLPEKGIEPDHDNSLFRFLLRIGQGGIDNDALYERYEAMLNRMGIHIEPVEGEEPEDITHDVDRSETDNSSPPAGVAPQRAIKPPRRVSFNDSNYENTWRSQNTKDFQPPEDVKVSPQRPLPARAASQAIQPSAPPRSKFEPLSLEQLLARTQLNLQGGDGEENAGLLSQKTPLVLTLAQHDQLSDRRANQKHGRATSLSSVEARGTYESPYMSDSSSLWEGPPYETANKAPTYLSHPSETRLLSDAQIVQANRRSISMRRLIRKWRDMASSAKQQHREMENRAISFDMDILLRQGLDEWRTMARRKRRAAETEKFYATLEQRADQARNLFLLTKAFTHWAQCASEEVDRTSVARRHILRTKYFNAWKEITVVNEMKVRRNVCSKFMVVWRQRTAKAVNDKQLAVAWHEERLVNRLGWQWWHQLCARIAPGLNARWLRRRFFLKWVDITRWRRDQELQAEDQYREILLRKSFMGWKQRSETIQEQAIIASQTRNRFLLVAGLDTLRKTTTLTSPAVQTVQAIDARRAKHAIQTWRTRIKNIRQATQIDQSRLLRDAWTQWNDRLRSNIILRTRDDHALMRSMFLWMLAERCALHKRLENIKRSQSFFQQWKSKAVDYTRRLELAASQVEEHQRKRLITFALVKWHGESRRIRDLEQQAVSFRTSHLRYQSLPIWREKVDKIAMLDRMCDSARFYVLSKSSIRKWKEAILNQQRLRRRETYATVRRTHKMNLVRRLFAHWRGRAAIISDWQATANKNNLQRVLQKKCLSRWLEETQSISPMSSQAGQYHSAKISIFALSEWKRRVQLLSVMNSNAEAYQADKVDAAAASALKAWGWKIFQARRMEESAKALWSRSEEKRRRGMLRYWAERTSSQRAAPAPNENIIPPEPDDEDPPLPPPGSTNPFRTLRFGASTTYTPAPPPPASPFKSSLIDTTGAPVLPNPSSATARAEQWTNFDDGITFSNFIPSLPQIEDNSSPLQNPNDPPELRQIEPPPDQANEVPDTRPMSTPLPGYLRTPSKRTARSKARFRNTLGTVSHTPIGTPGFAAYTPAVSGTGRGVTPFASKLRGIYSESRLPRRIVEGVGGEERGDGVGDVEDEDGRDVREENEG